MKIISKYSCKRTIQTFAIALTYLSASNAAATATDVYCGKVDQSGWYWLEDDNHQQITTQGNWEFVSVSDSKISFTEAFIITAEEYDRLKPLCGVDYVPQPANHRLSPWAVFAVETEARDGYFLAPGYYRLNHWQPSESFGRFLIPAPYWL